MAAGVETTANTAANASKSEHVAAVVRSASERTATGVRNAPKHAAAAPKRLAAAADGAAANTASKLGSTNSAAAIATASRQGSAKPDAFGDAAISTGAAGAATGHAVRHIAAGGWRNVTTVREAPTQTLQRAGDTLAGSAVPTTQPASPASAGAAPAGAPAMALLGLLGLICFSSQRLGAVVWLRPASAPASPFLALPERPG